MVDTYLRIEKRRLRVELELSDHRVIQGQIFLFLSRNEYGTPETPHDLLNNGAAFLVVADENDEIRFYNKAAIVRLSHLPENDDNDPGLPNLQQNVALEMQDESALQGEVRAVQPKENTRLFDYLNQVDEPFMRIVEMDGRISLVNKFFIRAVRPY